MSPEAGRLDEDVFAGALDEDPDGALGLLADMASATDERLRALARALAGRLFLDLAKRAEPRPGGIGALASLPYQHSDGDLDIDASIETILDARAGLGLDAERLRVRGWTTPELAVCLAVDRSGSMGGQPLAANALAAAAVALRCPDAWGALAFARTVVVVKPVAAHRGADAVVDALLTLRGHGTTDLAGALWAAGHQLELATARRRVTVLLSDCRPTEEGDAHAAAAALDELRIIAPAGDDSEARALADSVGASVATITGPSQIPQALATLFDRR